ncbi:MAG: ATP-binding cassette domain-containing protein, partial [Planctomycetota bacterium]|nr:ATP-binding cassette domain-containing protein [Planctomycetota bacterium]
MEAVVLDVQNVSHNYSQKGRPVEALNEINLQVAQQEIVAVRGDSGSGKTTLLLACGAMLRPSEGEVFINQQNLFSISTKQRNRIRANTIGYVFQTLQLVPYLSVLENLTLHNRASKQEAVEWLERFSLENRLQHKPGELSHGQRQRIALIRAIAHHPSILIADEPTGNLDENNSALVLDILRHFAESGGA